MEFPHLLHFKQCPGPGLAQKNSAPVFPDSLNPENQQMPTILPFLSN